MATISIFRGLLIAALVLLVVGLISAWTEPEVPEAVAAYLDSLNEGSLGAALEHGNLGTRILVGLLAGGYLLAYLVSLVGLLRFQRWARTLFIMLMPLSLALEAAMGTSLSGPMDAFESAALMIDGALLVLLFVDPVRARFRGQAAPPVAPAPPPAPPF